MKKVLKSFFLTIKKMSIIISTLKKTFFSKSPVVIAVGDSWMNLTVVNIDSLNVDIIDWLRKFGINIVDAGIPGYKISEERKVKLYNSFLCVTRQKNNLLIVSLGGNDLIWEHLNEIVEANWSKQLMQALSEKVTDNLLFYLHNVSEDFEAKNKNVIIIINGYDYLNVKANFFGWEGSLSQRMQKKGVNNQKAQVELRKFLNIYCDILKSKCENFNSSKIHFVDNRGILKEEDWWEDAHPSNKGFEKITKNLINYIEKNITDNIY